MAVGAVLLRARRALAFPMLSGVGTLLRRGLGCSSAGAGAKVRIALMYLISFMLAKRTRLCVHVYDGCVPSGTVLLWVYAHALTREIDSPTWAQARLMCMGE